MVKKKEGALTRLTSSENETPRLEDLVLQVLSAAARKAS